MLARLSSSQVKEASAMPIDLNKMVKGPRGFRSSVRCSNREEPSKKNPTRFAVLVERKSCLLQSRFRKNDNCVEANITINGNRRAKGETYEDIDTARTFKLAPGPDREDFQCSLKTTPLENDVRPGFTKENIGSNQYKQFFRPKRRQQFEDLISKYHKMIDKQASKVFSPRKKAKLNLFQRHREDNRTRYDLESLSSLHRSIFTFAKGSDKRAKKAFVIVLNLSGILLDEQKLKQTNFSVASIRTFAGFMKVFRDVEIYYFQQSINDYLTIIFSIQDDQKNSMFHLNDIAGAFGKRMNSKDSQKLANEILDKIRQHVGSNVQEIELRLLYEICINDNELCQKIHEKYMQQLKKKPYEI